MDWHGTLASQYQHSNKSSEKLTGATELKKKIYQFESCSSLLLSPILFRRIPTAHQKKKIIRLWLNAGEHPDAISKKMNTKVYW